MKNNSYQVQDFLPLIAVFGITLLFSAQRYYLYDWGIHETMADFMGSFFLILAGLKLYNWNKFVEAFREYDIIAQRSKLYAFIYPLIELTLGVLYILRYYLTFANIVTILIMGIGTIGVAQKLLKREQITCACLGAVFKIPMTYVSLLEDILMGLMALYMLIY